jgi:branched-chain amino acid transport system substrate-binding protein
MIPDGLSTLAYDAVLVLVDAMKRSSSLSPQSIRDALAKTQNFPGVTGKITLDANRNPVKSAVILTISDRKVRYFTRVEP